MLTRNSLKIATQPEGLQLSGSVTDQLLQIQNYVNQVQRDRYDQTRSIQKFLDSLNDKGALTITANSLYSALGLKFPTAQGAASTDPNTLDDYAEGSWTPTIKGATTAGTQTYSLQTGTYTKIGRVVIAPFRVTMTAKDGATAGSMRIGGLPFTVSGSLGGTSVSIFANLDLTAGYTHVGIIGEASTKDITFVQNGDNVGLSLLAAGAISATTDVAGTLIYTV